MKEITEGEAREALRVLRILSLDGSENGTSDLYERGISLNCLSSLITHHFLMEKALKEIDKIYFTGRGIKGEQELDRLLTENHKFLKNTLHVKFEQVLTGKGEGE